MTQEWNIYCEEAGDKAIPVVRGSSKYYIITGILVHIDHVDLLQENIKKFKYKVLRHRKPLEWKELSTSIKKDDKRLAKFLRKVEEESPPFYVTTVVCNKVETIGPGLKDRNTFMNYLYGHMFKRLAWFLQHSQSRARLIIDRNTDPLAQKSLKNYLSELTRYTTGNPPRHSKPKWTHPELDPILGLSDFISGLSLRALENYHNINETCNDCDVFDHIYECLNSGFEYRRSYKRIVDLNYYDDLMGWDWKGLLYHPYQLKDEHKKIFQPR